MVPRLPPALLAMPSGAPTPTPAPPPPPPPPMAMPSATPVGRGERPLGVTILAVLEGLAGLAAVLVGIGIAVGGSFLGRYLFDGGPLGALASVLGAVIGGFVLIVGLIILFLAWGFWTGAPWAWTVGVVLTMLGIVFGLLQLLFLQLSAIVGLLIDFFLIWYYTRDGVQRWFGKQGAWPAAQVNGMLQRADLPR